MVAPPAVTAVAGKLSPVIGLVAGLEIGNTDADVVIATGCCGKSLKLLLETVVTVLSGNGLTCNDCSGDCCCVFGDIDWLCCCTGCTTVKVANDLLSFRGC